MSKRPDTNDDATSGRRRRRRRGGLRVPSDNVPRRNAEGSNAEGSSGEEAAASAPADDPRLAVSVAYSFGAEGSSPSDALLDEEDQRTVPVEEDEPFEGAAAQDESEPQAARAADDLRGGDGGGGDDDGDDHETDPSASAGEAEKSEDDESEEYEDEADEDEEDEDDLEESEAGALDPDAVEDEGEVEEDEQAAADDAGKDELGEDEGETVEQARSAGGPAVSMGTLARREQGDSVEIAFDDEDSDESPAARRAARAKTIALGDQDLEELMEDDEPTEIAQVPEEPPEVTSPATPPPPPEPPASAESPSEGVVESELDNRKTLQVPVLSRPDSAAVEEEDSSDETNAVPAPVEHEEQPHSAAPVEAGDSGEIIADDMIEEIREGGGATAAGEEAGLAPNAAVEPPTTAKAPPPPTSAPPPAPSSSKRADAVAAVGSPQTKARRRKGKPWFEEIFDEDYLRTLPFLTPQATQAEAGFVMESVGVDPGGQVLDVGCGYGRHAMELAARGYHVVGLDSSLPLLLRGADEAQRRGLTINFVHGDMREMSFEAQFDGAFCLFNTFGYFDDETNKKTAQNIARALKPGARFVVDVLNRDYVISDLPARVWWEGDGCVVLEEVEFNYFSSRIVSNRSVVFDDGRQLEQEISIRAFSLHELGKLLHAAGFRVVEISGSMATRGRFFGAQSRDIVMVTERRGKKDDK